MPRTRTTLKLAAVTCLALMGLAACQATAPTRVAVAPEREAEMFTPITALEGEWEMPDEDGSMTLASRFAVTANNSAVREIMFPGSPYEMTNLYHMDGNDLVITHYCAAGNQPRMVTSHATQTDEGTTYFFDLDSVSNLRPEHDHYMGNMTLTILNDGTLREDWRSYQRDGSLSEPTTFVMHRR